VPYRCNGLAKSPGCPVVICVLTNILHQEWSGIPVKTHKQIKALKTQNLHDHMSEAELIFTRVGELPKVHLDEKYALPYVEKTTQGGYHANTYRQSGTL
jgi:hypothetical protein